MRQFIQFETFIIGIEGQIQAVLRLSASAARQTATPRKEVWGEV